MRVLITGATGFIGQTLCRRLVTEGHEVHAVSRRRLPSAEDGMQWHVAQLDELAASQALLRRINPRSIVHLASQVTGSRDRGIGLALLEANLMAAVCLMQAASEAGGIPIVLAGSVEEHAASVNDALLPRSPYGAAKAAATAHAKLFAALYGLPAVVLRLAMVYGPGQPDLTKLIPYVATTVLRGERPTIASPERLVDWIYIDDVVDAFVRAVVKPPPPGQVLEIGSGRMHTIRQVVELFLPLLGGASVQWGNGASRALDAPCAADPGAAAELLGWIPQVMLEEGLRRTADWYGAEERTSNPPR